MSAASDPPSAVAESKKGPDTMVIKSSCAFRAKYEETSECYLSPLKVVPHPLNRGGDPVKPLRCKEISSVIYKHGCDVKEAEWNAVLINKPPPEFWDEVREACCNPDFEAHYAANVLDAEDMCVYPGPKAEGGSVSHGHLNCTLRNCQTGKVGCECRKSPVVAGGGRSSAAAEMLPYATKMAVTV